MSSWSIYTLATLLAIANAVHFLHQSELVDCTPPAKYNPARNVCDCPSTTPYYSMNKCISCFLPKYFNHTSRLCLSCNPGETFNTTLLGCAPIVCPPGQHVDL